MVKRSTLTNWLHGHIEDDDNRQMHKVTTYAEIMPQTPLVVLIFGSFMAYFLIVCCGTMGSPNPLKINQVNCGLHNNCTIYHKKGYDVSQFLLWRQGL